MIFIYLTNPNKKTAEKIAQHLLKKRLTACVNAFPISSFYWWKKKIVKDQEWVLIIKTRANYFSKIKKEIEKIHPYQIPCLVAFSARANEKFQKWLIEETK